MVSKNGNHEHELVVADSSKVTDGKFYWAVLGVRGEVTTEAREKFRRQCGPLPVDSCPSCDSPFVAHIDSAKGLRHICAECFETWEECHWVPPREHSE